jgi:hypothetical protein
MSTMLAPISVENVRVLCDRDPLTALRLAQMKLVSFHPERHNFPILIQK